MHHTADSRDWLFRGACRSADPELFFPVGSAGPALRQVERAKEVCGTCEVIADCLAWALGSGPNTGVWGGLTEDERRLLKHEGRERAPLGGS